MSIFSIKPEYNLYVETLKLALNKQEYAYASAIGAVLLSKYPHLAFVQSLSQEAFLGSFYKLPRLSQYQNQLFSSCCSLLAFGLYPFSRKKSLSVASYAIKKYPKSYSALSLLARFALKLEWKDVIVFVYKSLSSFYPNKKELKIKLAKTYLGQCQYKEAMKIAEKLLEEDPTNVDLMSLVQDVSIQEAFELGFEKN